MGVVFAYAVLPHFDFTPSFARVRGDLYSIVATTLLESAMTIIENRDCTMAYETVATTDELPNGERIVVGIDDVWVAVFNVDNQLYAIEDRCTHDDGPLAEGDLEDHKVICPRHGAKFDLETGKPTFPAVKPVARFAVKIEDDAVLVDIDQRLN